MSKIVTTFKEVTRAYNKVRMELWDIRVLWDGSKLEKVGCTYLTIAPIAALGGYMGFYDPNTREIEFPSVYLPIAALWRDLGVKANALDVIRHEFGHALADLYPGALKKGGTFRTAFGGAYGEVPAEEHVAAGWGDRYVSEYATSSTQEDFAETFMLFVKYKGKIPAKFAKRPVIRKKWRAVAEIVKRVAVAVR